MCAVTQPQDAKQALYQPEDIPSAATSLRIGGTGPSYASVTNPHVTGIKHSRDRQKKQGRNHFYFLWVITFTYWEPWIKGRAEWDNIVAFITRQETKSSQTQAREAGAGSSVHPSGQHSSG